MMDRKGFEGVWVQTITPIGENEDILLPSITRQYEHLAKSNITGIIPFGPVGEFPSLTIEEKRQILRRFGQEAGTMKIMPQIGDNSLHNVLQLASFAESGGCDAVCVIPPLFYSMTENSLFHFYKRILESVKLPVFLYYIKTAMRIPLTINVIGTLTKYNHFYGIVDGGTDISFTEEIRRKFPNLVLLSARDRFHQQWIELGASGIVTWLGNAYPWIMTTFYNALKGGDMASALDIQQKIAGIRDMLRRYPFPASLKYTLYQLGFPAMKVRSPLENLPEDLRTRLKTEISRYLATCKIFEDPACELYNFK
jgi:4-hydroxy-tetrahydrodipicolinate synthase